ncbi:MAG: xanthine dehydrogenase family protein subunit M [Chloroflexi bacterium]|nr:xanthine dehydrogenase family protein subunit M [Chloroflexota bacterium]
MRTITYHEPRSVDEACQLLAELGSEARVIAGGQSLMVLLKQRIVDPGHLIDIKRVAELDHVRFDGGAAHIGALTTHRAIETGQPIRGKLPMLSEAVAKLGSVQIRNWGTVGGNLAHADPAGDLAPILIALGASVKVVSARGTRSLPLESFFQDFYETALGPDELLAEVEVPEPAEDVRACYVKESIRLGDMAIVGVGAALAIDENSGRCTNIRIIVGAVDRTPVRASRIEEALRGALPEKKALRDICQDGVADYHPLPDIHFSSDYKRTLMAVLIRNVLEKLIYGAN